MLDGQDALTEPFRLGGAGAARIAGLSVLVQSSGPMKVPLPAGKVDFGGVG